MTRRALHSRKLATEKAKGFTMLEVVIYVALFSILMSGIVIAAHQLLSGGDRNQTAISIQEEGTFISRKLNWVLTGASVVTGVSALTVIHPALGSDSPLVISGDGKSILLQRATGQSRALNASAFTATDLAFQVEPAQSGKPQAVTVEFKINSVPFIYKTYLRN